MILDEFINKECTFFTTTSDTAHFICAGMGEFVIYHPQDCCERVCLEEILGEIPATPFLIKKITETGDISGEGYGDEVVENQFYLFETSKGDFILHFNGTSNGFYGTSVYIAPKKDYERWR